MSAILRIGSVLLVVGSIWAQEPTYNPPPQASTPADNGNLPATLIQPIERAADYLNFYAFFDGIYDRSSGVYIGPGVDTSGSALEAGGGISANKDFATGSFSMSYRGDYRTGADPSYPSGSDHTLSALYRKRLNRRWTLSLSEAAGIYPEGTTILQPTETADLNVIQTTPFALKMKFTGTTVALSYVQSPRLSYELTGSFDLIRYNSSFGTGSDTFAGTGTVLYRLTRATSVSGTYQAEDFIFQRNFGRAITHTVYATLSHTLPAHWTVGVSGGATYAHDSGTAVIPVDFQIGSQVATFYVQGHYSDTTTLPYLQGTVSRNWRHMVATVSGGDSVSPGNGFFLTSRSLGINGIFSYTTPRSNISAGGYFSRLTSIANTSSAVISTRDLSVSYAYNLIRHVGSNIRFDYIGYGQIGTISPIRDERITFGLYFTSKDIPIALF